MSTLAHMTLVFGIAGGKLATFGWDFQAANNLTQAELLLMNAAAISDWNVGGPIMKQYFTSNVILQRVSTFAYDRGANPTPPPAQRRVITLGPVETPANAPGTGAGTSVFPNVALVCSFRTEVSSRRTRGRIYLPPIRAAEVLQDGSVNDAYADVLEEAVTSMAAGIQNSVPVAQDLRHVVVSLAQNGPITRVTDYEIKRRIDTQRRRLSRALDIPS